MKHLALTDLGTISGFSEFQQECKKQELCPVFGCEFFMCPGSENSEIYHLVLLASNETGYQNLVQIASCNQKAAIDDETLKKYHHGLIGLSGSLSGEIPSLILENKVKEAKKRAIWFRNLFGKNNFFLELQDHGFESQKQVNKALIKMSRQTRIQLVAANNVSHIKQNAKTDETYFKAESEMIEVFPEQPKAIANTVLIAKRCNVVLPQRDQPDTVHL
jgi:DNA polymerase-3 subunit alpha